MREIKFKISIILLLVSVVGIAALVGIAQSEHTNNKADNFDDNLNLVRVFRLVNSLNKEAEKQEAKGFAKRAEMLRNYLQKKTGISNEAKLKLNELATNFQKESEKLNIEIKEVRKNQKNKPNDEALKAELGKLRESRNKLFDSSRESLKNGVSKDDSEKIIKFLQDKVIGKSKKIDKSKLKKDFKKNQELNWFSKISYNEPNVFEDEINGYSMIDYDPVSGEIFAMAVTEGMCAAPNQDGEQEFGCSAAAVYAEIKNEIGEVLDENGNDGSGDSMSVEFYATEFNGQPLWSGQYCIYAQHGVETNNDYQWLYAESSDCVDVEIPETPTVKIMWNGNEINDTTQEAIVGQKIDLSIAVTGGTPTNQQWTIDGDTVKNYSLICTGGQGLLGTTICESPTNGVKTNLANSDLSQNSVSYYWWKGSNDLQVQISVMVDGVTITASANFNVLSPTSSISMVRTNRGPIFVEQRQGKWFLDHGDQFEEGIRIRHDTIYPQGVSGATQWLQTYKLFHRFQKLDDTWERVEREGIDTTFPYPPVGLQFLNEMRDTPGQDLSSDNPAHYWKRVEVNDSANTWVMFKSDLPNSIWVPLASVNWTWNAVAVKQNDGSWVKTDEGKTGPTSIEPLDFPIWSLNVKDFAYQPE